MSIFDKFNLTPDKQRKGRRLLRQLASNEYFGDASNLLVRIIATKMDQIDLMEEADKMQAWCDEKNKSFSVLRFNNWIKRASSNSIDGEIARELKKVDDFKKRYVGK